MTNEQISFWSTPWKNPHGENQFGVEFYYKDLKAKTVQKIHAQRNPIHLPTPHKFGMGFFLEVPPPPSWDLRPSHLLPASLGNGASYELPLKPLLK
jgi:hypothetical protein